MKTLFAMPVFGLGFTLIAGCSSTAAPSSNNEEEASTAEEQQLLAGDIDDMSGIAFDDANDKSLDDGAASGHVSAKLAEDATRQTWVLGAEDAEDDANVDAPAGDTTPEEAASATPDSTIGQPANNRPRMSYHGGPVMEHQNVYFIYYGNWARTRRTRSLIHNFVNALHYNNFNHSYFDGLEYKDHAGNAAASRGVALKGAAGVGYPYGKRLSQGDIARVVHSVLNAGKFSPEANAVYFVMTSADVAVAGDTGYCGWHNWQRMDVRFQDNFDVKVNVKYGLIVHADRNGAGCSEFGSPKNHSATPNKDYVADSEVSILSHEMVEAMTDPQLNAWFDSNGLEDSDKCNFHFMNVRKVNGAYANLYDRHYRRWWLVQSQYRHNDACGMGASR